MQHDINQYNRKAKSLLCFQVMPCVSPVSENINTVTKISARVTSYCHKPVSRAFLSEFFKTLGTLGAMVAQYGNFGKI